MLRHKAGSIQRVSQLRALSTSSSNGNGDEVREGTNRAAQNGDQSDRDNHSAIGDDSNLGRVKQPLLSSQPVDQCAAVAIANQSHNTDDDDDDDEDNHNYDDEETTTHIQKVRRKRAFSNLAHQSVPTVGVEPEVARQPTPPLPITEADHTHFLEVELQKNEVISDALRGLLDEELNKSRQTVGRFEVVAYLNEQISRHALRKLGIQVMLERRALLVANDDKPLLRSSYHHKIENDEAIASRVTIYDDALQLRRYRERFFPRDYQPDIEENRRSKAVAEYNFDTKATTRQKINSVVAFVDEQQRLQPQPAFPLTPISTDTADDCDDIDWDTPTFPIGYSIDDSWDCMPSTGMKVASRKENINEIKKLMLAAQQEQQSSEPIAPAVDSGNVDTSRSNTNTVSVRIPVSSKQQKKNKKSAAHIPAIIVALAIANDDPVSCPNTGTKMEGVMEYRERAAEDDGYDDLPDDVDEEMGESGVTMEYVDSDGEMEDEEQEDLDDAVPSVPFNPVAMGLKEINGLAHLRVSSYKPGNGVPELMSDDLDRYWQSDGIQPHRLTMTFVKAVEIRAIRFYVNFEQDESYTPTRIDWLAGTSLHDLHQFATSTLLNPRDWIDVPLTGTGGGEDGNSLVAWVVQMVILENHQNGKDTHIRGVRVYGFDDQLRAAGPTGPVGALETARRDEFRVDETKDADENEKALMAHIRATQFVKEFSAGDPSGTASSLDFMEDPTLR